MLGSNAPFYREIEQHIATLGIDRPRRRVPPGIKPDAIGRLYGGVSPQTGGPEGEYTMYGLGAEFIEV
jgi:hypothetical protein